MALTYEQFIAKVGDKNQFVKFINKNNNHFGFSYKIGLNQDTNKFNPTGSCRGGGLYFTNYQNAENWMHYGIILAPVILCKDAQYYIEPCGTKYKTDKFYIEEFIDLDLNLIENKQPNFNICRIALIKNWKIFSKLNYYALISGNNNPLPENVKIYNTAISQNNEEILHSVNKLYKNDFSFYIENENMIPFYNYIGSNDNMCIAGGYPTLHYLNKNLSDYPNSDIDVFILKTNNHNDNNDNQKITIQKFLIFLNDTYMISSIKGDSKSKCSIFDVVCLNFSRKIQIICTNYSNIAVLLNSFDSSHCKCCFYMNNTYVTPDAKLTKNTGYTCFYSYYPSPKRIEKVHKLRIDVLNLSNRSLRAIKLINEKPAKNKMIEQHELTIDLATSIAIPMTNWGKYDKK